MATSWLISLPFFRRSGFLLEMFPQPQRGIGIGLVVLGLCAVLLEVSAVLGYFASHPALVFQAILLALLLIAFSTFVILMVGIRRTES